MKPPFRIAILECDTPPAGVVDKFGKYGKMFEPLLNAGADALEQPDLMFFKKGLELPSSDVVNDTEYPSLGDVDAS